MPITLRMEEEFAKNSLQAAESSATADLCVQKTKPVMAGSTRRRQQICRLEREGQRAGDKKEKYSYKGRIRPGQREQWPAEANIGGTFSALHRAGVPTARRKAEDVTVCP